MGGIQRKPLLRGKSIRGLKVIVADDDARMREFYRAVLAGMGHEVVGEAADGRALLDVCLSVEADLVVSDIRMPEMSGIQAAHIVTECRELPFLFVSAYHENALVHEGSPAFSYGYLAKPIKKEDLATAIPVAMRRFWEALDR
jgi:DNA-binding NarL/FixJ family response regulator